jgi:hypothetical protein
LRFPHFLEKQLTDGGEVVSLTNRPEALYPQKIPGTHFCWRLSDPRAVMRLEGIGKLKKSNDLIWN